MYLVLLQIFLRKIKGFSEFATKTQQIFIQEIIIIILYHNNTLLYYNNITYYICKGVFQAKFCDFVIFPVFSGAKLATEVAQRRHKMHDLQQDV